MKLRPYDIVIREDGKKLLCLEGASDLESAKSRVQELASLWPGEFQVLDVQGKQMVAKVINSPDTRPGKP